MSPVRIENAYIQIPYIKEAFVYGSLVEDYLIGIFTMHKEAFKKLAKNNQIKKKTYEELCEDKKMR